MAALGRIRGILETSTVILLPRLSDPKFLPAEPVVTAATLAELSVGPLAARSDRERRRVRHTCNRPKLISIRFRSTRLQPGYLGKSPTRCGEVDARPPLARTTP